MKGILIKNARVVNDGATENMDLLIEGHFIKKIARQIDQFAPNTMIIDAKNRYLIPGVIDDQVHFREPGLTHKANIASESKAAIAGGITSFFEMPNTQPQTTTIEAWEEKNKIAASTSYANYAFMFGGTNDNLAQIQALDSTRVPALKLFLGSSTGNMLVDNPDVLRSIFSSTDLVIAVHCEDETTIQTNLKKAKDQLGDAIPMEYHPIIRSEQACYLSSSRAVALAKET